MGLFPSLAQLETRINIESRKEKKEAVIRLIEAMISGCVDLSPEEMVDAAFIMVNKINDRLSLDEVDFVDKSSNIQLR